MVGEICAEIKNYFVKKEDILVGDYSVQNGTIVPSVNIAEGQYYRIIGSIFNDGVHKDDTLHDEGEFHGAIWLMRVPQDIIELAEEIEAWKDKYMGVDSQALSPYQSESFGGYSYSKASGGSRSGGSGVDWKDQAMFASRLNPYRRIRAI